MKILCIGDSNTYGYDPRSYIGSRYPEKVRWTGRLSGHEVINCGLNGMTVPRDHQRQLGLIDLHEPDLVTVMLGTNDLLSGLSADEITGRMGRFLDSLISAGRPVLLITPPVLKCGVWVTDDEIIWESEDLGAKYRELAKAKGCWFADSGEWGIDVTFDGVHFSPEGHAVFAQRLEEVLKARELK
ncbi:MAG: lipase [Mogibacterium sp.]|nr:lipase [Mogibacterium sp.]